MFFLKKIRTYILPYADILSWRLMPNHFHLMVLVNDVEIKTQIEDSGGATPSRTPTVVSINKSIGIMIASYTRAINKQNDISGSLFRKKTKAECINCPNGVTPSFVKANGITQINIKNPKEQYPQICFDYIHQNPVKAGLVKSTIDWEFSSAADFSGIRNGKLINKETAKEYIVY